MAKLNTRGFSLAETVITMVVIAIVGLGANKLYISVNKDNARQKWLFFLRSEGSRLMTLISNDLQQMGKGLDDIRNEDIIKPKDEPLAGTLPGPPNFYEFCFFYDDENGSHKVDNEDRWIRFYVENESLIKEVSKGPDYDNLTVLSRTKISDVSVKVEDFFFNLFSSQSNSAILDEKAASMVKISMVLSRGDMKKEFSDTVLLDSLQYGL